MSKNSKSWKKRGEVTKGMSDYLTILDKTYENELQFGFELKLIYQKLKILLMLKINEEYKKQQAKMISKIQETNKVIFDFLNHLATSLDSLSKHQEVIMNKEIYLDKLSKVEKLLDKIQNQLFSIQEILEELSIREINSNSLIPEKNATNRNMNILIAIRSKIDSIDELTGDTRGYRQINRKYNYYNNTLLVISGIFILIAIIGLQWMPRSIAGVCIGATLIGILGIYKDKKYIINTYFPKEIDCEKQ